MSIPIKCAKCDRDLITILTPTHISVPWCHCVQTMNPTERWPAKARQAWREATSWIGDGEVGEAEHPLKIVLTTGIQVDELCSAIYALGQDEAAMKQAVEYVQSLRSPL